MKATIKKCKRQSDALKQTSTCVIKAEVKLKKHAFMFNNTDMSLIANKHKNVTLDKDNQKFLITAVGVSKCSPSDVYNETIGLRVAECKAKRALFHTMRDINASLYKYLMRLSCEALDEKQRYNGLAQREKDHIAEM